MLHLMNRAPSSDFQDSHGVTFSGGCIAMPPRRTLNRRGPLAPAALWLDDSGTHINAQGACLLIQEGIWYGHLFHGPGLRPVA